MARQRKIPANYLSLTGVVSFGGKSYPFESALERDFLITLAFDFSITQIITQYCLPEYFDGFKQREYTPDVFVERRTKSGIFTTIYEVKYRKDLKEVWADHRPRFAAANAYCRARGWRFEFVTDREIRGPFLQNARFFRAYLSADERPVEETLLRGVLRGMGPTSSNLLLAAAEGSGHSREQLMGSLWRLVARGLVVVDWNDEITMTSPLSLPEADHV